MKLILRHTVVFLLLLTMAHSPIAKKGEPATHGGATTDIDPDECMFEDLPLYGKVKFVDSSPDLKIKFVNNHEDLRIKFVNSFADDCGEWQVVDSFPDLKVQVVANNADIEVKVVYSFPGLR